MLAILLAASTLLTSWQFRQEPSEQMPNVDTTWHEVRVPHDWAISGPFDRANDLQEVVVVQNGESEPTCNNSTTVSTIQKLCDGLGITIIDFFNDDLFKDIEPEVK